MDITSLFSTNSASIAKAVHNDFLVYDTPETYEEVGSFDEMLSTNAYLSDAENEEMKWAMGETENTHDLTIALSKASTALQYTVAIRDKLLDAYREIMQMQI